MKKPPARVLVAWPVRAPAYAVPKGMMGSIWYRSSLERSACVPRGERGESWSVAERVANPLRAIARRPREVKTRGNVVVEV